MSRERQVSSTRGGDVDAGPGARDAVEIELYGLPRQRAGVERCSVPAGTLAQVLGALARRRPGLVPDILTLDQDGGGHATRHVLVALDGRAVLEHPDSPIERGQALVLLSAHAGG